MNALPDRHATDELMLRDPGDGRTLAQRLSKRYAARITGAFVVPGREGAFAPLPADLPPSLAHALRTRGIEQLYSHQAEAWAGDASRRARGHRHADRLGQVAVLHAAGGQPRR